MGEFSIALDALDASADHVSRIADLFDEIRWPAMDPAAMPGAAVSRVVVPEQISAQLTALIADLHAWAETAHFAADEFARAELRAANGLPPR